MTMVNSGLKLLLFLFIGTLAGNWSFIIIPMIRATSSKLVHADEQGNVMVNV